MIKIGVEMDALKLVGCAIGVLFIIGIAALFPFINIWSINQLFKLNIEYTFYNWLASFWLTAIVFRPLTTNGKNQK